jgi:hypothetical protein
MLYRSVISVAAAALLGIACVSTDALAYRGGGGFHGGARVGGYHGGARVGGYHGAVYRGGAYRGAYVRRGYGVGIGAAAVGAAAVGAAIASPYYYNYYNPAQCGYAPYPPCY